MLPLSRALKHLISQNAELEPLRRQAVKEGYKPMRLAGAQKVAKGLTTIEEVLRVTPVPMG